MSHSHHDASFWTRRHAESVVLDIGDDVGALILYTSAEHHTEEIEVSLLGADPTARRVHSAVLERYLNGRTFYAATYPELLAGDYQVWCEGTPRVTVQAGAVAELHV
jgi:hypothetical protein